MINSTRRGTRARSYAPPSPRRRALTWAAILVVAAIAAAAWFYRAPIQGYAGAGTAYAARVGCSCRFVAGRSLDSCGSDLLGGMELISLSDDADEKSVTATFPLIKRETATFREGYGCVLESWED